MIMNTFLQVIFRVMQMDMIANHIMILIRKFRCNSFKGKKNKRKDIFEVPKDAKEIKIEYDINFLTSDKMIFVYQQVK